MKKGWVIVLLCICLLFPLSVKADSNINYKEISLQIKITKDSKVYVEETGEVGGQGASVVVRRLPFYFITQSGDKRLAKISDVEGSALSFRYSNFGDAMYLQAKTNDKKQTYTLSYVYDFSSIEGIGNTLYIPLLRKEDYENIERLSFDFEFEDLDELNQFQWLFNQEAIADNMINYHVSGNHIRGSLSTFTDHPNITFMMEVPNHYFDQDHNNYHTNAIIFFLFTGFMLIIAFILYLMAKRKVKRPPYVKTPPGDLTPAEIGLIYKGEAGDKEIMSYIVSFATRGFLKIEEITKKDHSKVFQLRKLKDMESDDDVELYVFEQLFSKSDHVVIDSLKGKFYAKLAYAKKQLNNRSLEDRVYDKKSYFLLYLIYGLTLFAFLSLELCFCFSVIGILSDSIICVLFTFFAIICLLFTIKHSVPYLKQISYTVVFIPLTIMVLYSFTDLRYNWFYVVCIIMMLVMLFLGKEIQKRFQEHSYIVRKIEGFRRYLKESQAKSSEQFYEYLPYAYVLGVSKQWIRHNQENQIVLPTWINHEIELSSFAKLFEYYMEIINTVLSMIPENKAPKYHYRKPSNKIQKRKTFEEETKIADAASKKQKEKRDCEKGK